MVRTEMIDKSRDVGKIVVIVTDGYSTDDIRTPSKQLQDNGVIIFGVAFGPDSPLKRRTMQDLVSRPTTKYNTLVNYDQLVESSLKIAKHVCEGKTSYHLENLGCQPSFKRNLFPANKNFLFLCLIFKSCLAYFNIILSHRELE